MWPHRIALVIVLIWSAFCLTLAGIAFVNVSRIESPERYIVLGLGLAMLYMGGTMLAGVIWPPKEKDPDAPIEVPPLEKVRGRTSYRDDSTRESIALFLIGAIFLAASLGSAAEQPILLVISVISVGVLAGAGVKFWRRMQFGRARLKLAMPARRGDTMHGVITISGSAWTASRGGVRPSVDVVAYRTYRGTRQSRSVVVGRSHATTEASRDGRDVTIRFTAPIPLIDTSEGRFSWNVQFQTRSPKHRATFVVDVA
ncbi:MAG TPA: hypothetical protein VF618_24960 [Thermoanaerobaculia bacterium]